MGDSLQAFEVRPARRSGMIRPGRVNNRDSDSIGKRVRDSKIEPPQSARLFFGAQISSFFAE